MTVSPGSGAMDCVDFHALRIRQESGRAGAGGDMLDVDGRPFLLAEKVQQAAGLLRGCERVSNSPLPPGK